MADFYYRSGKEIVGPLTGIQLREAAFAGLVAEDTLVSNSAQGPWSRALRVKGLFDERGRPLPHPPVAQAPVPPPIQLPVWQGNSVPPARRRRPSGQQVFLSPALVITAVAIAGGVLVVAISEHQSPRRPVATRTVPPPASSPLTESRTATETEHASSLEPDDRRSAADASSRSPLASGAQARNSTSVPTPVRTESDDETPKSSGSSSKSPERDLPTLIADIGPSVVLIAKTGSYGSGFVVGKGIVATNYHVIAGGGEVEVWCKDGTRANVLGTLVSDAARDLALLQVDAARVRLKPLPVSTSIPPSGQFVFALGYPLGLIGEITPTDGIVSAKRSGEELCTFYDEPRGVFLGTWIQTTVAINKGNSGGPLLDMRGQVVGMSTLIGIRAGDAERAAGINFVISCLDLVDALEAAKSAAVTPLPKKSSPAVAARGSTVDGTDSASDWLQPVTTSERFLWSLPAGSFYIDGDGEMHQFTSPQREWGQIVGFTIDSILVRFDNSKAIGYVRLVNLGTQVKTVGAHMRVAEADLRRHDATSDADLLSGRWKQSQRGMITHGAMQDGKNRQHRIDTGTNIRPPGPTATEVWYHLMIRGINR